MLSVMEYPCPVGVLFVSFPATGSGSDPVICTLHVMGLRVRRLSNLMSSKWISNWDIQVGQRMGDRCIEEPWNCCFEGLGGRLLKII